MAFGLLLVVAGLPLVVAPLQVARVANWLRFVPFSTERASVHMYRLSGAALVCAGVLVIAAVGR